MEYAMQALYQLSCIPSPYPAFTALLLAAVENEKSGHHENEETSTEGLAWSKEVKANWDKAIWKGRCNMLTLLPVSCPPHFTCAFAILGPHSKASMWLQLRLAKDIYP